LDGRASVRTEDSGDAGDIEGLRDPTLPVLHGHDQGGASWRRRTAEMRLALRAWRQARPS
jgi:hypothetical protein